MLDRAEFGLEQTSDGLLLHGKLFGDASEWKLSKLGQNKILLHKQSESLNKSAEQVSFGWHKNTSLAALIQGLILRRFNGLLAVEVGDALKHLYFNHGELVFASSSLSEDRLGAVIYRAGWITIEQLTEAAVQVNRNKRFGRVMIEQGWLTSMQLWDCLKLQVLSIFASVLYEENVHIQLQEGFDFPPMAISFDMKTSDLLDDALGDSLILRHFDDLFAAGAGLLVRESLGEEGLPPRGTFIRDVFELAEKQQIFSKFLANSKLSRNVCLFSLHELVRRGLLDARSFKIPKRDAGFFGIAREVVNALEVYDLILNEAVKMSSLEGASIPVRDIEVFLEREYSQTRAPVFLQADGAISSISVIGILVRANVSKRKAEREIKCLHSLVFFLVQLMCDLLPNGRGWELKQKLQNKIT